jgi:hypothetical protein
MKRKGSADRSSLRYAIDSPVFRHAIISNRKTDRWLKNYGTPEGKNDPDKACRITIAISFSLPSFVEGMKEECLEGRLLKQPIAGVFKPNRAETDPPYDIALIVHERNGRP